MTNYETLTLERDGAILRVWLSRPERLNALSGRALDEIADLFGRLQSDFEARVIVLGGRGRAFCAGADRREPPGTERLASGAPPTERERRWISQIGLRACEAIARCEAVTLARLHGHVIGGGFALAASCDFRLAANDAQFLVPEVDLGIPLTWGAAARLRALVGEARAKEIILLCDRFDAATAERWGLVHRAVAPDVLDATVEDWARRLAQKPESAVHRTKTQFRALAARDALGDVRETDGDLLSGALHGAIARASFPRA